MLAGMTGGSGLAARAACTQARTAAALAPAPALAAGQFYFAQIEPGLRPESVLERLSALRGA